MLLLGAKSFVLEYNPMGANSFLLEDSFSEGTLCAGH